MDIYLILFALTDFFNYARLVFVISHFEGAVRKGEGVWGG